MKLKPIAVGIALLCLAATLTLAADSAWFDLTNCTLCKNFGAEKGLMAHVRTEIHELENGMLTVANVDEEYRDAFKRAHKGIQAAAAKMQPGDSLCGFCTSYGALMTHGVTTENIPTEAGMIGVITSDDPAVVEMIHAHAKRSQEEYAAWQAKASN